MKIPKSLQETAANVDPVVPESGVEVHLALYATPDSEPRRFAGVFTSAPRLDELIELPGEEGTFRVLEVRRSVRGLAELKADSAGSMDAAYEKLAKRGVPFADEIVFVIAEGEAETEETAEDES